MSTAATIPNHLGIILDGNRRWAKLRNLPVMKGHRQGSKQVEPIAKAAWKSGIKFLSLFVFSIDNWGRTQPEVDYLMNLFIRMSQKENQRLIKEGYRIKFAGRRDSRVAPKLASLIEQLETDSAANTGLTIIFHFNYGGQQEIVDAVKKIVDSNQTSQSITRETIFENLYHPDVPEVDFLIRTSGEQRISSFALWRASYSEFLFVDKCWPDFNQDDLRSALEVYSNRHRRFGGN